MLVSFQDRYYNYKGVVEKGSKTDNKEDNGLAIRAFESAFCADVAAMYVHEMCENIINKLLYAGTYHDDGMTIFKGQRTVTKMICWLCNFQLQVDKVAK
eukprot:14793708-Ditylum_brightwellii.AAC.1